MKTTTIGVYETHEMAIDAAKTLKENGFTDKQISIIWHQKNVHGDRIEQSQRITKTTAIEVGTGLSVGAVLGVLTGIGIFAIPGLGFLFGAGAIVGAAAGIDFGIIAGGIIGALSIPGIKAHHTEKYDNHLKEGRYLLLVQGSREEMHRANTIIESHGQHAEVDMHE